MPKKHIHFIGICGVAMSALAIALHKHGYKVTGSDKGFFPPVSEYLKNAGVEYYPGWHAEKMGSPDLVVVGNVAGSKNPEWIQVQENNIPYKSYPELIAEYFVKKNSIVCAGTYGKTTSSSLLAWILKENNFDPSYMFGGISLNDIDAAALTDSDYSILEGDEYKSSRWDNGPKFYHYSPTHLLLTSVNWDHADVYPTESLYVDAFKSLTERMPETGTLVISEKVIQSQPTLINSSTLKPITYGQEKNNDYQYTNVKTSKDGVAFEINHNGTSYKLQVASYGDFMADNITGCFAMAHQLGIDPKNIIKAVESFKNIKRRLEKRLDGETCPEPSQKVTIFDDIAHSPAKAEAVLASMRKLYDRRIFAIFEPNTGNRQEESIPGYANAFKNADEVIIPRLTRVKVKADDPSPPFDGAKLAEVISQTHDNTNYMDDDEKLVQYIADNTNDGDVVIFLGSHGFRGMIESLIVSFRAERNGAKRSVVEKSFKTSVLGIS